MANFQAALALVLKAEGGYQNDARDSGNRNSRGELVGTNYGISAPVYEAWIGRPPTIADMRNMTRAAAGEIYRDRYWNRVRGDDINDQPIANLIFDGTVNHGVSRGVKMVQKVLNIRQDGVFGTQTLAAVNAAIPAALYNAIKTERIRFYRQIAKNDNAAFLQGWLNRMEKFKDYAAPVGGAALIAAAAVTAPFWWKK